MLLTFGGFWYFNWVRLFIASTDLFPNVTMVVESARFSLPQTFRPFAEIRDSAPGHSLLLALGSAVYSLAVLSLLALFLLALRRRFKL